MKVFAIQWRDQYDPWGWESWRLFETEALLREAYRLAREKHLYGSTPRERLNREDFFGMTVRMVSMEVLSEIPEGFDPLFGDEPPGVEVML